MELVIQDAKYFKSCVDAIVSIVNEGTFEVSSAGMHLRTMDPSQIAMVDFLLPKEAFSKVDAEEKRSIALNLADLAKILARARPDESLTIKLDEKESKLVLQFVGESKRHFKVPLLEANAALPREPKIVYDASIRINAGALKDMLRDAGLLSSHVVLQADDSEFVVEAHGDSGDMRVETRKDSKHIAELKSGTKASAMFPFEYLDDMTKACPDDAIVHLELKNDSPVRLAYELGKAKICYYLAPRVETG
ncbi:proliferating cell nuclear antigen (pcna) [Candidatus Micrarchaeota archaeon CG08_land_8_20_14_0_20_59_11]|nr:MAG: proliferating cell nuclear antigen (pcna) [Candidatus Micrarchaeota archaeon CG08_land_8_20_14_0_20_59_11]